MNPILALRVDGVDIDPAVFAVPEMHLSSARSSMRKHDFEIVIRNAAVIELLGPAYRALIEELKADAAEYGDPDPDLSEAGYPDIDRLIEWPAALESMLSGYLRDEFLGALTGNGPDPILYWFDDTNGCRVEGELIHLAGICYSQA